MQTQEIFCLSCSKVNTKLFFALPILLLISSVGPSPYTKKLFLRLSTWIDELLSTPKITTFLAKVLPELHEPAPTHAIP